MMDNHDNKNSGHKGMMWMMIPCLLLLGILFIGGGKLSSGGYLWPVLIIGVFVVAHVWIMRKGHSGHGDAHTEGKTNDALAQELKTKDGNDKHKSGGCCH
jgi:hypothetical protein